MLSLQVIAIKAQLHPQLPALEVYPEAAVEYGGGGKERRQCCQQRFRERRELPHSLEIHRQGAYLSRNRDKTLLLVAEFQRGVFRESTFVFCEFQ